MVTGHMVSEMFSGPSAAHISAASSAWSLSSRTLALDLNSPIDAGVASSLTITAGITLPALGVTAASGASLSVVFQDGTTAVPAAALLAVAPVAAVMVDASLAFVPPTAGAVAALSLRFTNPRAMAFGDVVRLLLPGFTGAERAAGELSHALSGAAAGHFHGADTSWSSCESTLSLFPSQLAAHTAVVVTLADSAGISLPPGGVVAGSAELSFTSSTNAAYSIASHAVETVEVVPPALQSTGLAVGDGATAGHAASLR